LEEFYFSHCYWWNSKHNASYEMNVKQFKEDYESLLLTNLISPFLTRNIVKFLIPIEI